MKPIIDTQFTPCFSYKLIYIMRIEDSVHQKLLKIGDASINTDTSLDNLVPNCSELNKAAHLRIKQYTNTAGITYSLLHTELAVRSVKRNNKTYYEGFRDHNIHKVLTNSNIKKYKIDGSTGSEWFKVDLSTAIDAINAYKQGKNNLGNVKHADFELILFRPEQKDAINRTLKNFKHSNRMLWNAKMRFGKTLTSLKVIKESKYFKSIILTHRPVVNEGWFEDFRKIFYETDYEYGSKSKGISVDQLNKKGCPYVYFASIQDLRDSKRTGGKYDKNDDIFDTVWDLVIVDEAHEGTKTSLGDETVKAVLKEELNKTKLLALSGTPFNILDEYDENSIYTWDYIMEQERKNNWYITHFGDSNPYEELPELKIYTYDLGDLLHTSLYQSFEDKAFNFHEFFRIWTGDIHKDYKNIPSDKSVGDFVHEEDVNALLDLMTKSNASNSYPYSKEEYRELFQHTLWKVPGVKEAKALKQLMLKHPVFGCGQFNIINVAGNDDEESDDALQSVKQAIEAAENSGTYTITLSCGKLTTGVTIREWTAVFMLSGSYSTSAANYLQTIFRAQSPCNKNGKFKDRAYVFDFAPDRTLKMVAEAVSVSSKAGETSGTDRDILGKFLNFCPVISITGSKMKEYSADNLLQQLKKAYAERVVRNGFDDSNLYNNRLLTLDELEIKNFENLKAIIGSSKASPKTDDISLNNQGLTNEEYERLNTIKNKNKRELSDEEKALLDKINEQKKLRKNSISILRGISIRMPLLIYGANVSYEKDITLDQFVEQVDESSWNEFMPSGVTKETFKQFKKYYDEDVFIAAGHKIRNIAKEADNLEPTERVQKIASLFSNFKNPDKETVLTPWRVVNMHMSDTLGGYDFFDEKHNDVIQNPRFVDQGDVTKQTLNNIDTQILEINSKTGLYPLYVTYSIYRARCNQYKPEELTLELKNQLWQKTVCENVFVICKTPMAKSITQRTLLGYSDVKINAHSFDDLINQLENKPQQFIDKVLKQSFWKKGAKGDMKFDAVVGNPPYQIMDGGAQSSAKPIYNYFIDCSKKITTNIVSMIVPSRWMTGGKGLDLFRINMINNHNIQILHDYANSNDMFNGVDIKGGVCYFLLNLNYIGKCKCYRHDTDGVRESFRYLCEDGDDIFVRDDRLIEIKNKVWAISDHSVSEIVSASKPYGLRAETMRNASKYGLPDFSDQPIAGGYNVLGLINGNKRGWKYIAKDYPLPKHTCKDKFKVFISEAYGCGEIGEVPSTPVLGTPVLGTPVDICTETFLQIGPFDSEDEAYNFIKYIKTKFFRALVAIKKQTQHTTQKVYKYVPMQNFNNYSDIDWKQSIDDIDKQLFNKYSLSESQISFINEKIKKMD